MKNIHLLPTDKPSRLYLTTHEYIFEEGYSLSTDECENKHIYITSNEEIKEGDWVLNSGDYDEDIVFKADEIFFGIGLEAKKIILTTDVDLIKDGVQAIDDEFLEWFVKNPSCEEVEVKSEILYEHKDTYRPYPSECKNLKKTKVNYYLSIIPKEEPKQETLEEAKYRVYKDYWNENHNQEIKSNFLTAFKLGAKWQQEQDKKLYSEEDMDNYAEYCTTHVLTSQTGHPYLPVKEWFEQFKKK